MEEITEWTNPIKTPNKIETNNYIYDNWSNYYDADSKLDSINVNDFKCWLSLTIMLDQN